MVTIIPCPRRLAPHTWSMSLLVVIHWLSSASSPPRPLDVYPRPLFVTLSALRLRRSMTDKEAAEASAREDRERKRADAADAAAAEARIALLRMEAERDAAKRDAFEERRRGEADARADFERERDKLAEHHARALGAAEKRADKAMSRNFDVTAGPSPASAVPSAFVDLGPYGAVIFG